MRRIFILGVWMTFFALALSCGKPEPDPTPSITIPSSSQSTFSSGMSFQNTGSGSDGVQSSTVQFTASASWSADVSDTKSSSWLSVQPSSGGAGSITMTVTAQPNTGKEGRSASVNIRCGSAMQKFTVSQAGTPAVAVTSVRLNKTELSLIAGDAVTLAATVLPENATDKTITWSTSNAEVATVEGGKVTAVKEGEAVITAKAGDKAADCRVTVKKADVPVESITLDRVSVSIEEGQSTTLIATISPNDADEKTVTWATSNASVATVSNGVVTAIAEGTANITASAGGKSATCIVSVKKGVVAVTSVTLNKTTLNLTKGQSETLVATVKPDDATDKTVTWSSSDATIASVTPDGLVTALKSGTVTITAKTGEMSATCFVIITTPVESVSLDRTSVSLEVGQSTTLVATINPNDADEKTVTWATSNASVATVSNGVVTAIAEGTATITASASGKSAICEVFVRNKTGIGNEGVDEGDDNVDW